MGVIQKRADELKPGEVVVLPTAPGEHARRLVVLRNARIGTALGNQRPYVLGEIDAAGPLGQMVSVRTFNPEQLLDVEAPDLTPAQQHADELARLLHVATGVEGFRLPPDDALALRDLLDKIKPPEPPMLAETLAILVEVREALNVPGLGIDRGQRLDAIIARARRAGLLK